MTSVTSVLDSFFEKGVHYLYGTFKLKKNQLIINFKEDFKRIGRGSLGRSSCQPLVAYLCNQYKIKSTVSDVFFNCLEETNNNDYKMVTIKILDNSSKAVTKFCEAVIINSNRYDLVLNINDESESLGIFDFDKTTNAKLLDELEVHFQEKLNSKLISIAKVDDYNF